MTKNALSYLCQLTAILIFGSNNGLPNSLPTANQICAGKVTQLTSGGFCVRPIWSPDGRMIAFTRGKSLGIEVMNADGSRRRELTKDPGAGYKFAWSPDSREIAFRAVDSTNALQCIKVVDVATGKIESVSELANDLQPPEWSISGKGKRVCFISKGALIESAIRSVSAFHSNNPPRPALFFDKHNIWALVPGENVPRQVTTGIAFDPVISPDGSRIVYSQLDTLVIMKADGTEQKQLGIGIHPSWSPDSQKIVFQITRDHSHDLNDARQHSPETPHHKHDDKSNHQIVDSDLYIMDAGGGERAQLTRTTDKIEVDPCWSPDGKRIVYRGENDGQIYLIELEW